MADLAKVIEVLAEGDSIEGAIENAVTEASRSVRNIRNVYVDDVRALVEDNSVTRYRVNAKITFVVEGGKLG